MIALDTNVVVRLLVEDDASQTAAARRLVLRAREEGARLLVGDVVVCEIAWVLRACYGRSRDEIADALDLLSAVDEAELESADRIAAAIVAYRDGKGDLADYVLRESAVAAGCAAVATFDRALLKETGFVQPDPARWGPDVTLRETAPRYGRRRRRRSPPLQPQSVAGRLRHSSLSGPRTSP